VKVELTIKIDIPERLYRICIALLLAYRRLRYGYPFRRIRLTQGKFAIVDPEDYQRLNKHKWYAIKAKNTFYAGRNSRVGKTKKRLYIKMHREVLQDKLSSSANPPRGPGAERRASHLVADHINRNGLDNRKANLRPATYAQNILNRKYNFKTKRSPSKYKGVTWHKHTNKWLAQICYNRKRKSIGYFDNEITAAKAYDEAAKKYHKDFASLNFCD